MPGEANQYRPFAVRRYSIGIMLALSLLLQAEAQKMVQGVMKRLKPASTVEDVVRMALVR